MTRTIEISDELYNRVDDFIFDLSGDGVRECTVDEFVEHVLKQTLAEAQLYDALVETSEQDEELTEEVRERFRKVQAMLSDNSELMSNLAELEQIDAMPEPERTEARRRYGEKHNLT